MYGQQLVSVIVPVYNVENYLRKCLDSLINQSYVNLEILLVNDGSTDASGELCEEYAEKDLRVKVFHKENGGPSSARNLGLEHAGGGYITFIDSDDYLAEDAVESLVTSLEKHQADISFCQTEIVDETGAILDKSRKKYYEETVLSPEEMMMEICLNRMTGTSAWGKLYRSTLFEDIRFPVGKLYEDTYTTPDVVIRSRRVAFIGRAVYFWVQRSGSITHQGLTEKDFTVFSTLERFIKIVDAYYPALHEYAIVRLVDDTFWTIMMRLVYNDDFLSKAAKIRKRYRKYWILALRHPELNFGKKVQVLLALVNLRLYRRIRLIKNRR